MSLSGMLRYVAFVRADVSEECISIIRVTRVGKLQKLVSANIVFSSSILVILMM
jgi:hypothetical protein